MKALKGYMEGIWTGNIVRSRNVIGGTPVLVLDASKFPPDYPEIGSKWMYGPFNGELQRVPVCKVKIETPPQETDAGWFVGVSGYMDRVLPYWVRVSDLKPILSEPEVVGTLSIDAHGWQTRPALESGTYDIVRRP